MHNRVVHNYDAKKHKVNFSRYAEDFIVTAKTDEIEGLGPATASATRQSLTYRSKVRRGE